MRSGRSGLFLTELIFDLLLFAVCAAVCISLFAQAHFLQAQSEWLCDAVIIAQTAAEQVRLGQAPAETGWGDDGSYSVAVQAIKSDGMACYSVCVWNEQTGALSPIYTLDFAGEVGER